MKNNLLSTIEIHEEYISNIKDQLLEQKGLYERYKTTRETMLKNLEEHREVIDACSSIRIQDLHIGTDISKIKFTKIAENNLSKSIIDYITINMTDCINAYKMQVQTKNEIDRLKHLLIPHKKFAFICKEFNYDVIEEILNGHRFNMGFDLGHINIMVKTRKHLNKKVIDWAASEKKKAEILERGGTLYKAERDKDGNIIGDNGGEKWLVENTNLERPMINWVRTRQLDSSHYHFYPTAQSTYRPSKGVKRLTFVKRLAEKQRENPEYMNQFR